MFLNTEERGIVDSTREITEGGGVEKIHDEIESQTGIFRVFSRYVFGSLCVTFHRRLIFGFFKNSVYEATQSFGHVATTNMTP